MKESKLNNIATIVLFTTSYIPLFGLLILRQVKQNFDILTFGGLSKQNIYFTIEKFGLSYFFLLVIISSVLGLRLLLLNLDIKKSNGELVKIIDVENKNSESISYISTYIVPFIFQDTNNAFDIMSIFIVIVIIFFIYIKSNMIVINPILSITHTLYQIEYSKKNRTKKALLISRNDDLDVDQEIKINLITKNIYYG